MITLTNYVIDRAGFTLSGAPGTLEIFAKSSCQILVKTKKVLPSESGAPATVPYSKSASGYCITVIKKLDEGM